MSATNEMMQQAMTFEDETTKQLFVKGMEILQELALRANLDTDSYLNLDTSDNEIAAQRNRRTRWLKQDGSKPEHAGKRWTEKQQGNAMMLDALGLKHKEIAELLGKSPRAVESELRHLKKRADSAAK